MLAGFNFADFSAAADSLNLLGAATVTTDNRLRLTPAIDGQTGAAWYAAEKQFVGGAFSTTFQFQLDDFFDSPSGGSDGFTFAIHNEVPSFLGGGGSSLAYNRLSASLVVEFDTFANAGLGDPSGSHISVHTNGTGNNSTHESFSLGSFNTNPILDDGAVHTAKLDYQPGVLSIYLDNLTTPVLTVSVDLAEKLGLVGGQAWVGFTAATGGGWETHDILNWNFDVPSVPATVVSIGDVSQFEGDAGSTNFVFTATRSGDTSNSTSVDWTTVDGTATAGVDYDAAFGQILFEPGQTSKTIVITASGDTAIELHETFFLQLSNALGGAIVGGLGTGTILDDDDPTKFFVVNDASANRTYEYDLLGASVESYALASANTAPRGAASTAAGEKVWVVDANRKVYVYDASGRSLGSWTAGSLASNATLEGISTDGINVWIVDSRTDRVYFYAGAASFNSGNPVAHVSFSLASGNTNPKDIVTDGESLWVVDDGSKTDKVFKYTRNGTLLGSWSITTSGAKSPTGITLDPANPNDLWIVDNGTDRVYKYTAAVSRTSGSLSAAANFPLAPGNTNPQGIADPPSGIEAATPLAESIASPNTKVGGQIVTKPRPSHSPIASWRGTDHIDLLLSEERGPSARPCSFRLWHSLSEDAAVDAALADFDATSEHALDSVVALLTAG
jgi:hypothetical protein